MTPDTFLLKPRDAYMALQMRELIESGFVTLLELCVHLQVKANFPHYYCVNNYGDFHRLFEIWKNQPYFLIRCDKTFNIWCK